MCPKSARTAEDFGPNLMHDSFSGPQVHTPNNISIGSTVFAGLTGVFSTHTDTQTTGSVATVAVGHFDAMQAMRSKMTNQLLTNCDSGYTLN